VITKKSTRYYKVKSGDTVASIASLNGISEDDLIQLNRLSPPYNLFVGQRLQISQKSQVKSCDIVDKDVSVRPIDEKVLNNPDNPEDNKSASLYSGEIPDGMVLNSDGTLSPKNQQQIVKTSDTTQNLGSSNTNNVANPSRPLIINDSPAVANESVTPQVAPVATPAKFHWPVKGDIIQKFDGVKNKGINISAPKGTPVKSISDGVVKYVGSQVDGYGKMVMIKHGDGKISTYAHLQTVTIKENSVIKGGQKIGTVGNTGLDAGKQPQLHLQIRGQNKTPLDPTTVLSN
jgi:murein DD-endopeptidase MepM/ murein hydrolase activator NlpD